LASQTARISTIFAQVEATTTEVQEKVVEAMGYLAYSKGPSNYPIAAETADQAVMKAVALLEQLRTLRSALSEVKPWGY
jgi:hypothetical protein